ncbi:hypothetical protein ACJJTC_003963 [Scirpophaga incertulas]
MLSHFLRMGQLALNALWPTSLCFSLTQFTHTGIIALPKPSLTSPKLGPPSPNSSRDNQSPNLYSIWLKPDISGTISPRLPVFGFPVEGATSPTSQAGFRNRRVPVFGLFCTVRTSPTRWRRFLDPEIFSTPILILGPLSDRGDAVVFLSQSPAEYRMGGCIGPFFESRVSPSPKLDELDLIENFTPRNQDGPKRPDSSLLLVRGSCLGLNLMPWCSWTVWWVVNPVNLHPFRAA